MPAISFSLFCSYRHCAAALVLVVLSCILCDSALASSTGTNNALPYEEWLSVVQKSLTGPVAFSISLIGIVTCGAILILGGGEIRGFVKTLVFIVLVMTLLIGANSLMSGLFNGASIGINPESYHDHTAPSVQTVPAVQAPQPPSPTKIVADPYQHPTYDPEAAPAPAPNNYSRGWGRNHNDHDEVARDIENAIDRATDLQNHFENYLSYISAPLPLSLPTERIGGNSLESQQKLMFIPEPLTAPHEPIRSQPQQPQPIEDGFAPYGGIRYVAFC